MSASWDSACAICFPEHEKRRFKMNRLKMARVTRLELATSSVTGWRSNQLSYTPVKGSDIVVISLIVARGNSHFFLVLFADLSFARDNEFIGSEFLQPHRPARVQLIGADPDFRAHAKLRTIGESRGSIHIDRR